MASCSNQVHRVWAECTDYGVAVSLWAWASFKRPVSEQNFRYPIRVIWVFLGLIRDNGKENGSYSVRVNSRIQPDVKAPGFVQRASLGICNQPGVLTS